MSTIVTGGPPQVIEVLIPGGPPGPPGPTGPAGPAGATTLTDLTDVTGPGGTGTSPVDDGTSTFPLTRVTTEDDLNAILTAVAAVEWHTIGDPGEPPFATGFTNLGAPWAPARYRLTLNNVVHIEGLVIHDTPLWGEDVPKPIFQLPDDCLPGGDLAFIAESGIGQSGGGPTISRIVVRADGTVCWGGYITVGEGAEGFLSLSGINYSFGGPSPLLAAALAARFFRSEAR